jgi:hypothetical protein
LRVANAKSASLRAKHVQNVWVIWARDIASDYRAELRPLPAIRHREDRSQYRLERRFFEGRRKVSSGCAFQASHEIIGGDAEMREQ